MKYLLVLLGCASLFGCAKGPAHVRVQNLTGRSFTEVTVETTAFGIIPAGATSPSKDIAVLNHNPTVLTRDSKGDIMNRRVFHDPKGSVGTGKFIVALTLRAGGQLQVQVNRDDWLKMFQR